MVNNPRPSPDDLPENVREAFRDTALLSLPRVARLLGLDAGTLSDQVQEYNLPYRHKGVGRIRPRRAFGIDDVAVLWHFMRCHMAPTRSPRRVKVKEPRSSR